MLTIIFKLFYQLKFYNANKSSAVKNFNPLIFILSVTKETNCCSSISLNSELERYNCFVSHSFFRFTQRDKGQIVVSLPLVHFTKFFSQLTELIPFLVGKVIINALILFSY